MLCRPKAAGLAACFLFALSGAANAAEASRIDPYALGAALAGRGGADYAAEALSRAVAEHRGDPRAESAEEAESLDSLVAEVLWRQRTFRRLERRPR